MPGQISVKRPYPRTEFIANTRLGTRSVAPGVKAVAECAKRYPPRLTVLAEGGFQEVDGLEIGNTEDDNSKAGCSCQSNEEPRSRWA